VYYLTNFGVETEAPRLYDYFKDNFGRSYKEIRSSLISPTLAKAVAYDVKPLQVRDRVRSNYSENVFEAEATGLCKALKSELAELQRSEERMLHNKLIQKKREEAEAERHRMIEEELQREEERERGQRRAEEQERQKRDFEDQEELRKSLEGINAAFDKDDAERLG